MANRWAYAISMRRGDVTRVEEFCTQPQVLDARDRVESWLASQPRENRVRACLDRAASDALAQQLSRADCGDVWFLTSDGYIVLGPFATQGGALDMTTWLLRGGGNLLVDETPLTTRWMLSVLAFAVAKRGYVDALELLLSSSIFREGLTDEEYQSLLDCIARAWAASKVAFEGANMANVLLAHGCAIESLHGAGDLGSDDVNRVLMEHVHISME